LNAGIATRADPAIDSIANHGGPFDLFLVELAVAVVVSAEQHLLSALWAFLSRSFVRDLEQGSHRGLVVLITVARIALERELGSRFASRDCQTQNQGTHRLVDTHFLEVLLEPLATRTSTTFWLEPHYGSIVSIH
jgi:hypothetical protein